MKQLKLLSRLRRFFHCLFHTFPFGLEAHCATDILFRDGRRIVACSCGKVFE
jgi:hypothetical protein